MERGGDKGIQVGPAIELRGVRYEIGGVEILKDVNLELHPGRLYLLLGKNGSGKTTLLKIMAGLLRPTHGEIRLFGRKVENDWDLKLRTGYVFQNPLTQVVGSTVEEDVAFGLENSGVDPEEMEEKVIEILRFVGLEEYRCADPLTLSGGQIQRLAIASILVLEPDVILLDEPLSMLDPDGRREVAHLMEKMKRSGKTLVVASHDIEELDFVDEILFIDGGKVRRFSVREFFEVDRGVVPRPGWLG